jgi:non-homologous end joining protein Ku
VTVGDEPRSSHGMLRILKRLKNMKNHMRSASRYATKTPDACALQDEEHLQIIEELLNMKDAEFTNDECDNSVELEKFNFKL